MINLIRRWTCRFCGQDNSELSNRCTNCGQLRKVDI